MGFFLSEVDCGLLSGDFLGALFLDESGGVGGFLLGLPFGFGVGGFEDCCVGGEGGFLWGRLLAVLSENVSGSPAFSIPPKNAC